MRSVYAIFVAAALVTPMVKNTQAGCLTHLKDCRPRMPKLPDVKKIGDGWRQGRWLPGIPNIRPQSVQEVLFPVCWGSPQDCRDSAKKDQRTAGGISTSTWVTVSYRVDCRDRDTWADRADSTITVQAPTRADALAAIEQQEQISDLCQANGDLSRVTKPGTGRYLD